MDNLLGSLAWSALPNAILSRSLPSFVRYAPACGSVVLTVHRSVLPSFPIAVCFPLPTVTGYERQLDLKNRTRADVASRFAYLRNTLGRLVPLHRRVRTGVTSSRNRSIQGMWHTPAGDPRLPPLPVEVAARKRLTAQGLDADSLVEELGLEGFMRVLDRLATEREVARAGGGGDVWWDGGAGPDGVLLRRSGVASLGAAPRGTPLPAVAERPPVEAGSEQAPI